MSTFSLPHFSCNYDEIVLGQIDYLTVFQAVIPSTSEGDARRDNSRSQEMITVSSVSVSSSSSSIVSSGSESDYDTPIISSVGYFQRVVQTRVLETVQEASNEGLDEVSNQINVSVADERDGTRGGGLRPFLPALFSSSTQGNLVSSSHVSETSFVRVAAIPNAWSSAEAAVLQAQFVENLTEDVEDLGLNVLWPDPEHVQVKDKILNNSKALVCSRFFAKKIFLFLNGNF